MTEWFEHAGGGAPDLPPGTLVLTRRGFREGEGDTVPSTWEWWDGDGSPDESNWIWNGEPKDWSIVAYRVVPHE